MSLTGYFANLLLPEAALTAPSKPESERTDLMFVPDLLLG